MKAHEFIIDEEIIDEWSDIHSDIKKDLKKKGYKFLGSGVDQMAFLEPGSGLVLKIFGTQDYLHSKPDSFSDDHKMFFIWAKFCMKNPNNPFLPKFYGYESFVYDNCNYLQIRQEQLKESGDIGDYVSSASEYMRYGLSAKELFALAKKQSKHDDSDDEDGYSEVIQCIQLLGEKGALLLLKTLEQLRAIGKEHKWIWDLHDENVMCRGKTPVIIDPWIA